MPLRPPDETFVRTDADLYQLWSDLMGRGGFGRRSLWMIFIEQDAQLSRVVVPIDDVPLEPDDLLLGNLGEILEQVIEPPVSSVAMLLSRPGPRSMIAGDRRWALALRAAVDPALMPWPVHLATTDSVQVFAPDDLIAA